MLPSPFALRRFILAGLLLCLATAGSVASDLVRDLAAGRSRKVVAYGTSLTASGPWVSQMQTWMGNTYSGAVTIVNSGLSGKNSAEGLAQLSTKVLAHHPDTVFIEFAMNDAFLYSDGTPQLSVSEARANLISMIDQIRGQNPRVEIILQTMNSVWDSPAGSNQSATLRPNLAAYYQIYRDIAAERKLLLIDHHPTWLALQSSARSTFESYLPDGVHPNAAGTTQILMPLLRQRLIGDLNGDTAGTTPTLLRTDVCVYGGTSAAVAAAVQAARQGKRVVLLSPDTFLGGLSSNGLGWTDVGDPSAIGGIAREFYRRIYHHYLEDSVWTAETRNAYISRSGLDPDTARRMMFTFEPKIARRIFEDLLAESGVTLVRGRLKRTTGGVQKEGARIREIMTEDGLRSIRAAMFIDATYEGDLLGAAGVSYTVGREANSQYGETLNGIQTARSGGNQLPNGIDPYVVPGQPASGLLPNVNATAGGSDGSADARLQAYTFRMCLTDVAANRRLIAPPAGYRESDFELLFRAIEAGQTTRFFKTSPMPNRKTDSNNDTGFSTDFIGGNYNLGEGWNYAEAGYEKREEIHAAHISYQQGFVWSLQNHPRVPATLRSAWGIWGVPLDEFPETNGWPAQLYVREARRMVSDFVVTQKHVNQQTGFVAADSVGMGGYAMDSHHTQRHVAAAGVKNEGDVQVAPALGPYGISYRALVPRAGEAENLLVPVCLSASHIAYGSIRMEPVFMILGQSSGAAAVRAIDDGVTVQAVDYAALSKELIAAGQVLTRSSGSTGGIIVDNSDATGITRTGEWLESSATAGFHGPNYLHDANTGQGTKSVRYTPILPSAGTYEVFGRWTTHTNRATNVRFDIIHSGGTTSVTRNQQLNNGVWVSLGSYTFPAGTVGSVLIRNDDANGFVIADAVRFVGSGETSPGVSVLSTVRRTSEGTGGPGVFTVVRENADATPLDVRLAYSGNATGSVDFKALPEIVTIAAGSIAATVSVQALRDANIEGSETVTASISPDPAYRVVAPASANVTIDDPPSDRWKSVYFTDPELRNPAVSGNDADPDRDGVSNLLERGLGLNPRVWEHATLPQLVREPDAQGFRLRLFYRKAAEDLLFEVQQSSALAPGTWSRDGVSVESYDSGSGLFYQSLSVGAEEDARFLRLNVVQP
jgi:lysophospholipase L1-like esterase